MPRTKREDDRNEIRQMNDTLCRIANNLLLPVRSVAEVAILVDSDVPVSQIFSNFKSRHRLTNKEVRETRRAYLATKAGAKLA